MEATHFMHSRNPILGQLARQKRKRSRISIGVIVLEKFISRWNPYYQADDEPDDSIWVGTSEEKGKKFHIAFALDGTKNASCNY
jgi:hypothetical protein